MGTSLSFDKSHERSVADMISTVRQFDSAATIVVTDYPQRPFRFAMFYLRDYPVLRVNEPGGVTTLARNWKAQVLNSSACLDSSVKSVVWITEVTQVPSGVPPRAVMLDPAVSALDPARRCALHQPDALAQLFREAGLSHVEVRAIDVAADFRDFVVFENRGGRNL